MSNTKKIKSYCHCCKRETNHDILFSEKVSYDNDGYYWEEATYSVVRCCGCDLIGFHRKVFSEDNIAEVENGIYDYIPEITTYPFNSNWIDPIFSWAIPHKIREIYRETIEALNHGLDRLAGAGLRAVVEAVCSHMEVDGKNLESKINKLTSKGIITRNDRNRLHAIRFIGNDSIHVLKKYKRDELLVALNIVNGILNNLFVVEDAFEHLGERPISSYEDFESFLSEIIGRMTAGNVCTLKNIVGNARQVLKEDLPAFETHLIERINSGDFRGLEVCIRQEKGPQQYKIIGLHDSDTSS